METATRGMAPKETGMSRNAKAQAAEAERRSCGWYPFPWRWESGLLFV